MGYAGNLGLGGLLASPTQTSGYGQSQYGHYTGLGGLAAQQAQQQYNQTIANLGRPMFQPKWMIDGREMSMEQFANELFGDDTPEKTMFLLKYSKGEK